MTTAKKAPAKKAAAKKAAPVVDLNDDDLLAPEPGIREAATQLALDWLYKRAFRHGAIHHVRMLIGQEKLPGEVKDILFETIERNES